MRQPVHFLRLARRERAGIVEFPQTEPVLEMLLLHAEAHVRPGETTAILLFAAGLQCPELRDLGQMRIPILDVGIENRAEQDVLAHVHVERLDEFQDTGVTAEAGVKWFVCAHLFSKTRFHSFSTPCRCTHSFKSARFNLSLET